jgi:hypothetical protein
MPSKIKQLLNPRRFGCRSPTLTGMPYPPELFLWIPLICVMRDGNIMQVADPLTLYRKPDKLFVAGFIGSLPMKALRESQAVSGSPLFSWRRILAGKIFGSPWRAPGWNLW